MLRITVLRCRLLLVVGAEQTDPCLVVISCVMYGSLWWADILNGPNKCVGFHFLAFRKDKNRWQMRNKKLTSFVIFYVRNDNGKIAFVNFCVVCGCSLCGWWLLSRQQIITYRIP